MFCRTFTLKNVSKFPGKHWWRGSVLTLSWWRSLSYGNQSINLLCKSMEWSIFDRDLLRALSRRFAIFAKKALLQIFDRFLNSPLLKFSRVIFQNILWWLSQVLFCFYYDLCQNFHKIDNTFLSKFWHYTHRRNIFLFSLKFKEICHLI